jgi:murein L,D-transpeptidase YafK
MQTGYMKLLLSIGLSIMLQQISFKEKQQQFKRVKDAYVEKEALVKTYFDAGGISYRNYQVFLRAFKKEGVIEVWTKPQNQTTYQLLTTYRFCATSGSLGPKRKEGDLQIPEGIYHLNHFNPESNFHLSLGVSYPNASDKILADPKKPGGAIYVHGNCVTIGCIPITDEKIKELYILCVEAKNAGQSSIPIHIFPSRLNDAGMNMLTTQYNNTPSLIEFWKNLQDMYLDFEKTKILPPIGVDRSGKYYLKTSVN